MMARTPGRLNASDTSSPSESTLRNFFLDSSNPRHRPFLHRPSAPGERDPAKSRPNSTTAAPLP